MLRIRRLAIMCALALVAGIPAASAAAADAPLPVGQKRGVVVKRADGAIVVVFTKRAAGLYRRIAGKRVNVHCTGVTTDSSGRVLSSHGGPNLLRAPKRRRRLWTGDLSRPLDYCEVFLARRIVRRRDGTTRLPRRLVVAVPLTQRGAVALDERAKVLAMQMVLRVTGVVEQESVPGSCPATDRLVEYVGDGRLLRSRMRVAALADPNDTPARGAVGYYCDGAEHGAVVAVSRAGRRLFFEWRPDNVIYTNVPEHAGTLRAMLEAAWG